MKILFINGMYSHSLRSVFANNCKNGSLQDANDTFQWAVVEGLYKNKADFSVFSYPYLPCFPFNYKSHKIIGGDIVYENTIIGKSLSYIPFPILKEYSIRRSIIVHVTRWIENNIAANERFVVLTYTAEPFFIQPLRRLKKKYPNMIISSIVTDLVDDVFNFKTNRTFFKRIQSKIRISETYKGYLSIDKYILLTKYMEERIKESIGKNIVIEGIYKNSDSLCANTSIPKAILYTGVLEEYAGVKKLVDAFLKTSTEDFRLILCGSGPLEYYIQQAASKDSRIEFRGSIPRDEAVRLQKSVALLINPRQPNGGITKYSFPSKTMEYMSSGTPMIGYQLEGMPSEYLNYMYIPRDLSVDALTDIINIILDYPLDVLKTHGNKARNFILKNKTAQMQVKKILDFFDD